MKFSSSKILSSQRGVSLISALVAAAILGILVVMLATLQDNMAKAMLRSSMQRAADNLQRQIMGVLSQKELCSAAFRQDAAGTLAMKWGETGYGAKGIPFLVMNSGAGTPIVVASKAPAINPANGKPYNQVVDGLFIDNLELVTRDINNDGVPDPAVVNPIKIHNDTQTVFLAVPAQVRIKFRGPVDAGGNPIPGTEWVGGAFKFREIPVVVMMNPGTHEIVKCDSPAAGNMASKCLGTDYADAKQQALNDMGTSVCEGDPCVYPFAKSTGEIVYLRGFKNNGRPSCACQVICDRENQSWQDELVTVPDSPSYIPCPGPAGSVCETLNVICKYGGVGPTGYVHTRKCVAN